jgi:hypothetical protein
MSDTDDIDERIERFDSGASIEATLERGTGTRDEDKIRIKGKGESADAALAEFEQMLEQYEDELADRMRDIQPTEGGDDE